MEFSYKNQDIREIFERMGLENKRKAEFKEVQMQIRRVIADLYACKNVGEYFNNFPMAGTLQGSFAKIYILDYCLTFENGHVKCPVNEEGEIDWNKVKRIKILSLEKPDGEYEL